MIGSSYYVVLRAFDEDGHHGLSTALNLSTGLMKMVLDLLLLPLHHG